uniref:UDENN domain-containing protein n=1 Tax=Macrostomum lignano TaxID=282301 RepID=A0A1I8FQ87_9PLAT
LPLGLHQQDDERPATVQVWPEFSEVDTSAYRRGQEEEVGGFNAHPGSGDSPMAGGGGTQSEADQRGVDKAAARGRRRRTPAGWASRYFEDPETDPCCFHPLCSRLADVRPNDRQGYGAEPAEVLVSPDGLIYGFRPWEHIYSIGKLGKSPNIPVYNPYGKYVVRLFWLIYVDDSLPLGRVRPVPPADDRSIPGAVASTCSPRRSLKLAALDYGGGSGNPRIRRLQPHPLLDWLAAPDHCKEENSPQQPQQQQRPEAVVFASFYNASRRQPLLLASLADGADKSERLRGRGPLLPAEPPGTAHQASGSAAEASGSSARSDSGLAADPTSTSTSTDCAAERPATTERKR